jgi:anti-sigma regulatory factor (Ser/Thr protein kinase)
MRHSALLYKDQEDLLAGVLPFLESGSERGDSLLVAMPGDNLSAVREGLDSEAPVVTFMNLDETGGNPARLISSWQEFAATDGGGTGMTCVGESLWFGRSTAEIEECERHEALLNLAFGASEGTSLLCPYDTERLEPDVIDRVGHSHRELAMDGNPATESTSFVEAGHSDLFTGELVVPAGEVTERPFEKRDLSELRAMMREHAESAGLDRTRREDLVLAGDELATNSIRYAGGHGTMRLWSDEAQVICEVSDEGRLEDPMAGRVRPAPDQVGGRGLWLANQLCDLVQIRVGEQGNVIRLSMKLPPGETS